MLSLFTKIQIKDGQQWHRYKWHGHPPCGMLETGEVTGNTVVDRSGSRNKAAIGPRAQGKKWEAEQQIRWEVKG